MCFKFTNPMVGLLGYLPYRYLEPPAPMACLLEFAGAPKGDGLVGCVNPSLNTKLIV